MEIQANFLTQNDCFRKNRQQKALPPEQQDPRYRRYYRGPTGIVVHSTGADNPWLWRYVQPDDGQIGGNPYGTDWNRPGLEVCVNALIGKLKSGQPAVRQTLPWDDRPWGVGNGPAGSCNDTHIQFEICEDDHADEDYCRSCFTLAAELCAYLCRRYEIPVSGILSHHEAYLAGLGSGHTDPDNWWPRFGLTMEAFRGRVGMLLAQQNAEQALYRIRRAWADMGSQLGAYAKLENAVRACPHGYAVFDPAGKPVYRPGPAPAQSYNRSDAGRYAIVPKAGLHLRLAPGTQAESLGVLPQGTRVQCYGYRTGPWLCVVSPDGVTGFAHSAYLERVL